jgi:hypothetical protein
VRRPLPPPLLLLLLRHDELIAEILPYVLDTSCCFKVSDKKHFYGTFSLMIITAFHVQKKVIDCDSLRWRKVLRDYGFIQTG